MLCLQLFSTMQMKRETLSKKKIDEGTNGGHKIREHDAHQQMKDVFEDKDPKSLF